MSKRQHLRFRQWITVTIMDTSRVRVIRPHGCFVQQLMFVSILHVLVASWYACMEDGPTSSAPRWVLSSKYLQSLDSPGIFSLNFSVLEHWPTSHTPSTISLDLQTSSLACQSDIVQVKSIHLRLHQPPHTFCSWGVGFDLHWETLILLWSLWSIWQLSKHNMPNPPWESC